MSMAWREIAGVDQTSKMEHSYYFCRALYPEWLIGSSYATVYLTTFYRAHLKVDSFPDYTYWLLAFNCSCKRTLS